MRIFYKLADFFSIPLSLKTAYALFLMGVFVVCLSSFLFLHFTTEKNDETFKEILLREMEIQNASDSVAAAKRNRQYNTTRYYSRQRNYYHNKKYHNSINLSSPKPGTNPNQLSIDDWQALGFSKRQAAVILEFKEALGGFKTVEQLKQCFVLDSLYVNKIAANLVFTLAADSIFNKNTAKRIAKIDINTTTLEEWKKLKGIGKYYARNIMEYKKSLGGYYAIGQIREVYGISDSLFASIRPKLKMDTSVIRKININYATKKVLWQHPYISIKLANQIIYHRNFNGFFTTAKELYMFGYTTEENAKQINYYFSFD